MTAPALSVEDLAVSFAGGDGRRRAAVRGVRLNVHAGETVAIVGESGSGKSVTALSMMGLLPRHEAEVDHGRVLLRAGGAEIDMARAPARKARRARGSRIAMIFQEPMTSLNPVLTVGDQLVEALRLHRGLRGGAARGAAAEALERVGIERAGSRLGAYPHEFSGGMRQRVMIAMALGCEPSVLVADEPTTALDVAVQAQILDLIRGLQRSRGLAVVLITHALPLVARVADAVCVMYGGRVVEFGAAPEVIAAPLHPYTRGLLACAPPLGGTAARLRTVADAVEDEAAFTRGLDDGLRFWWPRHRSPARLSLADGPLDDCALIGVAPGRWAAVWRTDRKLRELETPPRSAPTARVSSSPVEPLPGARPAVRSAQSGSHSP